MEEYNIYSEVEIIKNNIKTINGRCPKCNGPMGYHMKDHGYTCMNNYCIYKFENNLGLCFAYYPDNEEMILTKVWRSQKEIPKRTITNKEKEKIRQAKKLLNQQAVNHQLVTNPTS